MFLKKLIIVSFFMVCTVSVFGKEWEVTNEWLFLEAEGEFNKDPQVGFNLGLPTLHFINNKYSIDLSMEIGEIKFKDYAYSDISLGKTDIMYIFPTEEFLFLGPFANIGIKSIEDHSVEYNIGIRGKYIFPIEFIEPIPLAARVMQIELGYSIDGNRFFFNMSADPVIALAFIGYMFAGSGYEDSEDVLHPIPEESEKDKEHREKFK